MSLLPKLTDDGDYLGRAHFKREDARFRRLAARVLLALPKRRIVRWATGQNIFTVDLRPNEPCLEAKLVAVADAVKAAKGNYVNLPIPRAVEQAVVLKEKRSRSMRLMRYFDVSDGLVHVRVDVGLVPEKVTR